MSEMGIFDTMYSSRAMRRLKPDPVPEAIISKVLQRFAHPRPAIHKNWIFVVITDPVQRREVGEIYRRASTWVRPVYENNRQPAHMNEVQYDRFWKSGT